MDSIRTVGRWSKLSRDMSRDRHCQPCAARIQPSGPRIRIRNAGDWGADMYRDRRSGSGHMYMYGSVPCVLNIPHLSSAKSFASTILSLLSHSHFRCNPWRRGAAPAGGTVSESSARALPRLHRTWSKTTLPQAQEQHPSPRLPRPRAHGHDGGSESVSGLRCAVLESPEYSTTCGAVRSMRCPIGSFRPGSVPEWGTH
jgi:hypothetical protein